MKIEITIPPQSNDIEFLTNKINEETPEYGAAFTFGFFIKDDDGEIIGGCNGSLFYGCIYTDQLWVHKDHRKQGMGRALMERVHDYGREHDCKIATVATMSFQNVYTFYENLGYHCEFERSGYVKDSKIICLKKEL